MGEGARSDSKGRLREIKLPDRTKLVRRGGDASYRRTSLRVRVLCCVFAPVRTRLRKAAATEDGGEGVLEALVMAGLGPAILLRKAPRPVSGSPGQAPAVAAPIPFLDFTHPRR